MLNSLMVLHLTFLDVLNVGDCNISSMKSHDTNIFMQRLLLVAIGGYLRHDIHLALMKLNTFFKELCARTCKK